MARAVTSPTKKPRTTATKKPSTTAKAKATPGGSRPRESVAAQMLRAWPAPSDIEREAFRSQVSDARCDATGRNTRSAAVLQDAMSFAAGIATTLREQPQTVRRYSPQRFAWLLECVIALDEARADAAGTREGETPRREAVERAKRRAAEARSELLHTLDLLATDAPGGDSELEEARGDSQDLVASVSALAKIADRWLRTTDTRSRALVASIGLTQSDVDGAWAAAEALTDALDRAAGLGPRGMRDAPSVNRAEGRLLFEMRYAMQAFDFAHERDKSVPKLVPSDATRHALGIRTREPEGD